MLDRFWSEIRLAGRGLLRSPLFTATAVLVVGIGIGSVTSIYTVVDGILLEPLDVEEPEEVLIVCEAHVSLGDYCVGSAPTAHDLAHRSTTLDAVGLARDWAFRVSDGDRRVGAAVGLATPGFFDVLEARPAVGRLFSSDEVGEDADVVVLEHGLWTREFGADPAVVGRSLTVDGTPHAIVGVLAADTRLPVLDWVELWRPLHVDPADEANRDWRGFTVLARMADGYGLEAARADLDAIYAGLRAESPSVTDEWTLRAIPLRSWIARDARPTLLVFLGAVGLLLLVACANVANLLLVRSADRERELAVRAALGAGHGDLTVALLAEAALLGAAGGALGCGVAWAGVHAFVAMAPPGIPRIENVGMEPAVLGFAGIVTVATVALVGLVPALRVRGAELLPRLRGRSAGADDADTRVRDGLVILELGMSVVLLAGAALLIRSFLGFTAWEPAFDRDGLVALGVFIPPEVVGEDGVLPILRRAEEAAEAVAGVEATAFASAIPLLGGREGAEYAVEGSDPDADDLPSARVYDVSPDYFRTLGVPLTAGRHFAETDDVSAPAAAMVNETLARRAFGENDPVGRRFTVPAGNWSDEDEVYTVVGVVADLDPLTPGEAASPEIYRTNRQYARIFPYLVLRTSTAAPLETARRVREALLASVEPGLEISIRGTMEGLFSARLVRPRFAMTLVATFAAAALLLTAAGVYGVLAYAVTRRRREIGIRLALGSTRTRVLGTVLAHGTRLALLGIAVGLLGVVLLSGVVSSVAHGVEGVDPLSLSATAGGVLLLALSASLVPAVRASRLDPVGLLRES